MIRTVSELRTWLDEQDGDDSGRPISDLGDLLPSDTVSDGEPWSWRYVSDWQWGCMDGAHEAIDALVDALTEIANGGGDAVGLARAALDKYAVGADLDVTYYEGQHREHPQGRSSSGE